MNIRRSMSLFIIFNLFIAITNHPIKPTVATTVPRKPTLESAQKVLQSQNGFFTENKGQWDSNILFVGDTSFGKVAFAKDAIYYQMIKVTEKEPNNDTSLSMEYMPDRFNQKENDKAYQFQTIKLSFADPLTPTINGVDVLSHYNNYFIGNDSSKWASYCRNFAKVTYQDIWKGIDLSYFYTPEGMKYEYYVKPYAKVQDLQIKVEGAELTNKGTSLQISTTLGNIQDANLKVFDKETNSKINSSFSIQSNIFSFLGIPEKRENIIVIDPLVYSTYLGGSWISNSKSEGIYGIAVDSIGNAYVCGDTYSNDFPITPGSYQTNLKGSEDIFITKINSTGSALIYSTYLGGTYVDEFYNTEGPSAITLDVAGNVYVCGETSCIDFPTTPGAFQASYNGGSHDTFITKIDSSGSSLIYSTYLGGKFGEFTYDMALDAAGFVYISGNTSSPDFPTSPGAYQSLNKGEKDAFVTKINLTGSAIVYSTYIGGSDWDFFTGMAIDLNGSAYLYGQTLSSDFPITSGAYQTTYNEGIDVYSNGDTFVTKLNSTGTALIYSTYLGGTDNELPGGIAIDISGNAYLTGTTNSTDFPTTPDSYQTSHKGYSDVFVTKLNSTGTALIYSTYIGGTNEDLTYFGKLCLDSDNNVFISGNTGSYDFPITLGAYQTKLQYSNGSQYGADVFVTKLNKTGTALLYSTFLGGTRLDRSFGGITLISSVIAYVIGETWSTDFPTTTGAYQTNLKGSVDSFISKLDLFLFDITLAGSLHFNQVNLAWNNTNPGNIAINGYQIYRANVNDGLFKPLAYVKGVNNRTYTDATGEIGKTYSYYIVAVNSRDEPVGVSNTTTLGPIQPTPYPFLELSIETNKKEFCKGEDILCKVTVHNNGYAPATDTVLKVTFHRDIEYQSADKYRGEVQPNGMVVFHLGTIPARSSVTFQINSSVATSIPFEKAVAIFFETSCKENSADQQTINLTLKRCGGGSPVLDIDVYYKNIHTDPQTGEVYLLQTEELDMDVIFSGFLPPFSYEIQWGDGTIDQKDKQTETKYLMKHKFTSKGKMVIKINATDASGRSKLVSLNLVIR